MSYLQLQASSQSYEKTTSQLGSLLHLVSSQLQLSTYKLSSHGGETRRRISRSMEENQHSTIRRSRGSSNKFEHNKKKESQLNRSQSCTQHDKLLLDQAHDKKDEHIQSGQKRKNARSKSTVFEFRNVCKHETVILDTSLCNIDHNMKQSRMDSKPGPGKALRRIKTFLSKSRKYQFESEEKVSASSKYSK